MLPSATRLALGAPFETERLRVRPFTKLDFAGLRDMMADDAAMTFENRPYGAVDVERLLGEHRLRPQTEYGFAVMAAALRGDDVLVAQAGFKPHGDAALEIVAYVARQYWGRGFASELLNAFFARAFEIHIPAVYALVRPGNSRAERLVGRYPFQPDGDVQEFGVPATRWRLGRDDYFNGLGGKRRSVDDSGIATRSS